MKRNNIKRVIEKCLIFFSLIYSFSSCLPEAKEWDPRADDLVISQFINDSSTFSEFNELLLNTKLNRLLRIRGPFTLFAPNNEAMQAYYAEKGYTSASDMDTLTQKELVYNHLVLAEISSGDIGLGALREPNALNDVIATEFSGIDIILNKVAKIVNRDIRVSNGYIHEIDHVLEPITTNIYDKIASMPEYSLFKQGLDLTGIKDTLSVVEFPYGNKMARTNFTILAVPDTIFNRYGIYTIDDMVNHFTDKPDEVTDVYNGFYQFIEYHCLTGTHFLSDLVPDKSVNPQLYPILSFNNNVLIEVGEDFMINFNKQDSTYTTFIVEGSNIPTKNGAIHAINDLLPVTNPEPNKIIFDTCDYFDVKQGDYYKKYYQKWYDGENTFEYVHWGGDYLQYYYKEAVSSQMNYDSWQMIGYWWIEITTPKIMKGNYTLSGHTWYGRIADVYVDGVKTCHLGSDDSFNDIEWGDFNWDTTQRHKIKIVSTAYSTLFWDTIVLTPITD